jgi:hypothetical protein
MQTINQFIKANQAAYSKASAVFKSIESKDYASDLIEAGITGADIKVYVTAYVAESSGVNPHPSQRGDTLVFKKDTAEYNRVKYLVDVVSGVREVRAAKKVAKVNHRMTPEARKAAKAFIELFGSKADAIAALKAI